jgi:hypothetical protein
VQWWSILTGNGYNYGAHSTSVQLQAAASQPEAAQSQREVESQRMISFSDRATVPANVLIRFLDQESVLLNLKTERYFGLDSVGTRMWQLVTSAPTIDAAYYQLLDEFDVQPELLRANLSDLLSHLVENGLIETQSSDVGTPSAV